MDDTKKRLSTFLARAPRLGKKVYLAPTAILVGDVTLGDHSSVWFNAVLRADINRIVVGHHTNVQDNCVIHVADELSCLIGDFVTIGHAAILHACTIQNEVLVGMGAVILDGATVGSQSVIGARALVPSGMEIPPGSLVLGTPARVVRALPPTERKKRKFWARKYQKLARYYPETYVGNRQKAGTEGVV